MSLFDRPASSTRRWSPPDLNQVATEITRSRELELDAETTGLRWWAGDRAVGWAVGTDAGPRYLPIRHEGSDNLPLEQTYSMLRATLRGKRITNLNTRFDVHIAYVDDLDLEGIGCQVSDVGHHAALLDDHRRRFNLEDLAQSFLGRGKLKTTVGGKALDLTRMRHYHPREVAPYACEDVQLVREIRLKTWPRLTEEDLHRVRALEDAVIYVVCEMERNASPIDREKLARWIDETGRLLEDLLSQVCRSLGRPVQPSCLSLAPPKIPFSPDSSRDWTELFQARGLPLPVAKTSTGRPSFTDAVLAHVDDPVVQMARRAGKIADLRSKYLLKYERALDDGGSLHYALHQLRTDVGGTVRGRFASSAPSGPDSGANVQQVLAVEKQRATYGDEWLIRELYVPAYGLYLSGDAEQIEYRVFAHLANSPRVIEAYRRDPRLSFHKLVWELLKPHKPDLRYKPLKNLNFARLYGAGLMKIAVMMEMITEVDAQEIRSEHGRFYRDHPKLRHAREIDRIYNEQLPEVRPMLSRASHYAKAACDDQCRREDQWHRAGEPHRGYVRTILGRRARFPRAWQLHKALNAVIQGSAADVMKIKLVELHEHRHETGLTLRLTNHDEVCGDVPDQEAAERVRQLLDRPTARQYFEDGRSIDLRVPILWGVSTGANWAECA